MKYTISFDKITEIDTIVNLPDSINIEYLLKMNPYDAVLKLSKFLIYPKMESHLTKELIDAGKVSISQIYTDYNEYMRLVEIDDRLLPLIESTDNEHFYRRLFFDSIFINSDFNYHHFKIKGLYASDMSSSHKTIGLGDGLFNIPQKNWLIMSFVYNSETKKAMFVFCELIRGEGNFEEPKEYKGLINHLRNTLCNVVDLVEGNVNDVGVRTVYPTEEQKNKRKEKGKVPIPTKVFVTPKEFFLKYISDFHNNMKLGYKFLVRGHWRHFRNLRYSESKRLNPTWIKPFYKGEGIVVKKPYLLKENTSAN